MTLYKIKNNKITAVEDASNSCKHNSLIKMKIAVVAVVVVII